jgi:hypothetical protein
VCDTFPIKLLLVESYKQLNQTWMNIFSQTFTLKLVVKALIFLIFFNVVIPNLTRPCNPYHSKYLHGTILHSKSVHGTILQSKNIHGNILNAEYLYGTLLNSKNVHGSLSNFKYFHETLLRSNNFHENL